MSKDSGHLHTNKEFSVPMSGNPEHDRIFGIRYHRKYGRVKLLDIPCQDKRKVWIREVTFNNRIAGNVDRIVKAAELSEKPFKNIV